VSPSPIDRLRQTRRLLRNEGPAGIAARLGDRLSDRLSPQGRIRLPVSNEDLRRAGEIAASGWQLPAAIPAGPDEPLTIAWVCEPTSGRESGGHTTMFRQVEALERAGHTCVVYFTNRHGWSIEQHRETVRGWWPSLKAEIRDAADIEDAHAIFATSWPTAYTVLASPARGARFYLVQDFEPSFYPAGTEALLAEATYRFGFHGVTAGRWLSERLTREYGMPADHFDFGCDLDRYSLDTSAERTGICYYARFSKPRRAYELGVVALELFAERCPDVDIHFFGDVAPKLPFRAVNHGSLTPAALDKLYNRCVAGLVLSATNVSLVPHEMLASGCLPVVNEAEHNRIVLDNDEVVYVPPTPFELADAMVALVERPAADRAAAAEAAARSVQSRSWADAGLQVEQAVRKVVSAAGRSGVPLA
jgi:glycosyltransferase involved in cell wall biosynthesis